MPNFRFVRSVDSPTKKRNQSPGFFFRADDVTGFLQSIQKNAEYHHELAAEFEETLPEGLGRMLAAGAARASARALENRYGKDPFNRSHGELFLHLLRSRMHSQATFLLDEPETPLSVSNQLALLQFFTEVAKNGSQLIIATHAPVLMALPGATILDLNQVPPQPIEWDEVEHVVLSKAFLNQPESFLKHLKNP